MVSSRKCFVSRPCIASAALVLRDWDFPAIGIGVYPNNVTMNDTTNNTTTTTTGNEPSVSDSSSSTSSDEDDEEEDKNGSSINRLGKGLSLLESRALNVERNTAFLESLGLLSKKKNNNNDDEKKGYKNVGAGVENESSPSSLLLSSSGVLLPDLPPNEQVSSTVSADPTTTFLSSSSSSLLSPSSSSCSYGIQIEQILSKFPGRSQQVHQLASLLMNGTCRSGGCGGFGSGGIPIFVTGPQGTGKTSLVQTIVNAAIDSETMETWTKNNNNNDDDDIADEPGLIPIYINLATCRDSWIRTIYQSVEMKLKVGDYTDQKTKRRKRKQLQQHKQQQSKQQQQQSKQQRLEGAEEGGKLAAMGERNKQQPSKQEGTRMFVCFLQLSSDLC